MRVCIIAPVAPDPNADHAGGRFLARYTSLLACHADVEVVTLGHEPSPQIARADPEGVVVTSVGRAQVSRWRVLVLQAERALHQRPGRALLWIDALSGIRSHFDSLKPFTCSPVLVEAVRRADVIELQWAQTLPLLPLVRRLAPPTPIIAFEHDVMTQSLWRLARRSPHRSLRWRSALQWPVAVSQEARLLRRCDMVNVFSDKDARLVRQLGGKEVSVISPGVDLHLDAPGPHHEPVCLFVGAMWRPENSSAIEWFLARCWPTIRARMPSARLVVAGSGPPDSLRSDPSAGVEVTGFVDDLDPLWRRARLLVTPLLVGAGVKFKVLEAMGYGLPVIATPVAAEGIVERSGSECFATISADPNVLVEATVRCLQDLEYAQEVGRRARAWVRQAYALDKDVCALMGLYRAAAERAVQSVP